MPMRARTSGRLPISSAFPQRTLPEAGRNQSHDGLEQGGLAHAVATHQAGHAPFAKLERDVPERVALTVELVDVVDLETHGLSLSVQCPK